MRGTLTDAAKETANVVAICRDDVNTESVDA
jgi:hypothetical protein